MLLIGGRHVNCQESVTYFFNFESSSFIHPTVPILSTPTNSTIDALAFDFGVVNQSLDLAGSYTHSSQINMMKDQYQKLWRSINNGNGQFPQYSTIFDKQYLISLNADSSLNDLKFIKLRSDPSALKDVVSVKNNTLIINQNLNGNINSDIYQYVPEGKGKYISTGRFNKNNTLEDILIVTPDNHIKIYKNSGTGMLSENESYYFGNITASKAILAQMTDKYRPNIQVNSDDKDELIIYNGGNITIYRNTNNNGFDLTTPFLNYNTGFSNIADIAVGDINNDGYNDLIVTSNDYPYTAKAFINVYGTEINTSSPYWVTTGYPNLASQSKILITDINKDGYNDIVLAGYEQHISVFSGMNLSGTADQVLTGINPYTGIKQVKMADINNLGSETLFLLYGTSTLNGQISYTVVGIPPYTLNPPPGKPDIKKETEQDGNIYHPKIRFYNNGERDFSSYKVYKMAPGTRDYTLIASNITNNYFIDYNEYIVDQTLAPGQGVYNCFYKVTSVDLSNQESVPSVPVGYRVGSHGCLICPIDDADNMNGKPGSNNNNYDIKLKYGLTSFPNPFNPTTRIVYSIPQDGLVNITVYNLLGQKVQSLVNEIKQKGTYLIEFNGSALPSGIYFVRMQSGNYNEVKKINLVK